MNGNNSSKQAIIFDIQHFSLDDGPGIRTTIFFKGCSLRCLWCHNPESLSEKPEILFYKERCTECGACCAVCPTKARRMTKGLTFDRQACTGCGLCVKVCQYKALKLCGRSMSLDEVIEDIVVDEAFCKSNGGITFSGGEAMLQTSFLPGLLKACKMRGLHTTIDTAGNIVENGFTKEILELTDLFLFDIKAMDFELHKSVTGSGNSLIHRNIRFLSEKGAHIWIRIPFIVGLTCTKEEIDKMAVFFSTIQGIDRVELLPYHRYGESKYTALGKACPDIPEGNPPSEDAVMAVLDRFSQKGIHVECPSLNKKR